jgi:ATP-binding cassette subfamily B protein
MQRNGMKKGFGAEARLLVRRAREVWRLVPRRHKLALGGAALVIVGVSLCNTAMPLLLGRMLDGVDHGGRAGDTAAELYGLAVWFLALLAGVYILRECLNVLRRYLVENTCTQVNRDMSVRLVSHLMTVDLASIAGEKVGALHGRIFRSVDGFVRFLRVGFLDFFPALFTGAFALVAAILQQPWMGLVMVGVVPVSAFLTVRQLISQKGVRLKLMRNCEEIDGAVVEQLGGMEYVRAANTHTQEAERIARATEKRRAREIRHHFQMALFGSAKALNEGFFHILVLALAISLAIGGTVSAGDVLTFSILFLNVMAPLSEVHRVLDEGQEASLRVGDLLEMLGQAPDPSFAVIGTHDLRTVPGEPLVEIENLRVEYHPGPDKTVCALDGLSLAIRHGETIGVAGRSGCGKSTWLKVLLRLVHPCGGRVRVGGLPLEELSRADIGNLFGYVGQTPFVFSGTVAQNIAYGKEDATREEIRRAAELAYLHDEIMELPGGYEALVTERGQNLSGGQRQRLAIARMLLKQAPVLILDEATSALDNISERHVQLALGITSHDRTTILVAHRLSTLRDADRIFVFDEGRIVEVGDYESLLRRGGVFAELVMSAENGVEALTSPEPAKAAAG